MTYDNVQKENIQSCNEIMAMTKGVPMEKKEKYSAR